MDRIPVVGDELGVVADVADLDIDALLYGRMQVVRFHRSDGV